MANPDFKMYPHVYNVLTLKGQHFPAYFDVLIDPYDNEEAVEKSEAEFGEDQHPDLYRLGLVRLHVQDASHRRAELVSQHRSAAQEAAAPRPRASRSAVQGVPPRDPALVRPLAQGHRHRNPERAAGAVLGDGRERMAQRQRLAAAGNAVDQVLSQRLGAAHHRAVRAVERRRLPGARRVRADAADADQPRPEAALSQRAAGRRTSPSPARACSTSSPRSTRTTPTGS